MAQPPVQDSPLEGPSVEARLLDAALLAAATQGVTTATMGQLAQEAGCSRATAYRVFGSKQALFEAAAQREIGRFTALLGARLAGADTLEDALTVAVVEAHVALTGHAALQHVLAHEPGVALPFLGFGRVDQLYATVSAFAGPHFARFVGVDRAGWVAELATRLVLSQLFMPRPGLDLADHHQVRTFVRRFLLPAFAAQPARQPPRPLAFAGDPATNPGS